MSRPWKSRCAQRTLGVKSSAIRELLKVTQKPEIISFGGGLPTPDVFPVKCFEEACHKVLTEHGPEALQYGTIEGYQPLREMIARNLARYGIVASAKNVLITSTRRSSYIPRRPAGLQRVRRAIRVRPRRRRRPAH